MKGESVLKNARRIAGGLISGVLLGLVRSAWECDGATTLRCETYSPRRGLLRSWVCRVQGLDGSWVQFSGASERAALASALRHRRQRDAE
tara:strand:+ start:3311 stop:3580 length:270 start_codon:yes stop_codon:yes gene_type:complete